MRDESSFGSVSFFFLFRRFKVLECACEVDLVEYYLSARDKRASHLKLTIRHVLCYPVFGALSLTLGACRDDDQAEIRTMPPGTGRDKRLLVAHLL
jgi:hypothetical protein